MDGLGLDGDRCIRVIPWQWEPQINEYADYKRARKDESKVEESTHKPQCDN